MRAVFPLMLAGVALLATSSARAEKVVGLGGFNEFLGVSIEYVGEASSGYVVLGAYQSKGGYQVEDLTGYVGYRRYLGEADKSTYFGGFFIGDMDGAPTYTRLGAGGELGYQWVTEHLRTRAFVGMAMLGEASGENAPVSSTEIEPQAIVGASVSLRF